MDRKLHEAETPACDNGCAWQKHSPRESDADCSVLRTEGHVRKRHVGLWQCLWVRKKLETKSQEEIKEAEHFWTLVPFLRPVSPPEFVSDSVMIQPMRVGSLSECL